MSATHVLRAGVAGLLMLSPGSPTDAWRDQVEAGEGFRWGFDRPHQVGTFVGGDWWVVAPEGLTLVAIEPATAPEDPHGPHGTGGSVWWAHGTHVDPLASSHLQGLDSSMYAAVEGLENGEGYAHGSNVAAHLPWTVLPGPDGIASICTARSLPTPGNVPQISALEILTVLDAPPPKGAFRPTYTVDERGRHQEGWLTSAEVDYGRVEVLDALGSRLDADRITAPPSIAACMESFAGVWYEAPGGPAWTKAHSRPAAWVPHFGYDAANVYQVAAMRTLLDDLTVEQKRPLIDALIQIGFDRYNMALQDPVGVAPDSGHWTETDGQGCAAKFSILYYAWLTDFPRRTAEVLASAASQGVATTQRFELDAQTSYVEGTARWGVDPRWSSPHRACCAAAGWSLRILMSRIIADDLPTTPATWASGHVYPRAAYDYLDRFHRLQPRHGHPPPSPFHFDRAPFGGSELAREAWQAWGASNTSFSRP